MCKVIAICNQKGGVSKTTTTVNLGVGMVREGKRVLVIDADPQGNLSQSLGIENPDELEIALPTIMEQIIMDEEFEVSEGIIHHVTVTYPTGVNFLKARKKIEITYTIILTQKQKKFWIKLSAIVL